MQHWFPAVTAQSVTLSRSERSPAISYVANGNLYLNITSHCSLRCAFCPKFNKQWVVDDAYLRLKREPAVTQILASVDDPKAYREIVFCGLGEPTQRLSVLLEVAGVLRARGARIRINTDGLANLVHGRDVTPEFAGRIDALSVSLNAQDEETYIRHCRPSLSGSYASLLDFVQRAREHVPEVTLTAIEGLPGVNIAACEAIAHRLGVHFRPRFLDQVG